MPRRGLGRMKLGICDVRGPKVMMTDPGLQEHRSYGEELMRPHQSMRSNSASLCPANTDSRLHSRGFLPPLLAPPLACRDCLLRTATEQWRWLGSGDGTFRCMCLIQRDHGAPPPTQFRNQAPWRKAQGGGAGRWQRKQRSGPCHFSLQSLHPPSKYSVRNISF